MVKAWSPSDRVLNNCPAPCLMSSSGESPPAYSHSSKYALFKVSPVGIQNTCSRALWDAFRFIWDSKVLVWHHCHHVFVSFWTRQSSLVLSPREERQHKMVEWCVVVTTAIFMDKGWCHQKVRRRRSLRRLADPFFCCLAHALCARCLQSFRPDTASIRSCLLLPPGFFDTWEAGV